MKLWKLLLIILSTALPGMAAADIQTISLAHEVRLSDFRAPQSVNGVASFKTCPSCELQVVNVTADTLYRVNGKRVSLQEFRRMTSLAQNRERELVVVSHHLENDVISLISISL